MVTFDSKGMTFHFGDFDARFEIDASKAIEQVQEIRNELKELIYFSPNPL